MATTKLTAEEIKELQQFKLQREKEDREKFGITDEYDNYEVPKDEIKHVHLLIGFIARVNQIDRTKDEISRPFVHKLTEPAYFNFMDNIKQLGYKVVKVLHVPKGVLSPADYLADKEKKAAAKVAKAKRKPANPEAALILDK